MPSRWRAALLITSILLFAVVIYAGMQQTTYAASVVSRVSVATDGTQGTSGAYHQAISGNGRFVVFTSDAPNLVPGDTNNTTDIFLRDTQTGTTTRVSITSSGAQATGDSYESEISDDGRFIVFASLASNLTTDHHWFGIAQVYLHDMQTGTTVRVSNTPNGAEPSGESYWPDISADGRYISFVSVAPDLITGGYNHLGIYVRDMQTSTTTLVSVASDGTPATFNSDYASISANGRFVVFQSEATNLVPGDTNGYADVFLHDRQTGTTSLVSIASNGTQGNGHSSYFTRSGISTDGRFIAFDSRASNLVTGDTNTANDVFVRDIQNGTTTRVSLTSASAQTNLGSSDTPTISGNGRYVVFASSSPDLVPNDTNFLTDIFVRDLQTGITTRVSLAGDGTQQNASSEFGGHSDISSDGSFVIYGSRADNLVSGDTNNSEDIFLVDWQLLPVPVTPTPTPTATSTTTPTPTPSPTPTSTPTLKPPSYTITSTSDPLQLTFGLDALLDKAPSGLASVTCDVGPCAWAWSSYLSGDIPGNGAATVVEWNGYFYLGHAPSLSLELYHGGSTKTLATLPSTEQQWPEIVASAGDILTARITMSGSGTLKLFQCDAQDCTPSHIKIATHGQLVSTPTPTATSTPTPTPTSTPTLKPPNYTITSTSDPLQLTFGLDALLDKAPSGLTSVTCDTGPCAWEWSSYLSGDVPGNGGSTIFHWGSYFNLGSPPSMTLELRHTGQTTVLAGWSSTDSEGPEVIASTGDILTVRITMGGSGTLNLFHCNGAGDDCTPMYFSLSTRRQLLYLPLISISR